MDIKKINSGELYKGELSFPVPYGKRFIVQSTASDVVVNSLNVDGELVAMHRVESGKAFGKSHGLVQVICPDGDFWCCDYQDDAVTYGPELDKTPVEVVLERPLSLIERMQHFIRDELANKYGRGSREYETYEDAQDFLLDDGDEFISPYEEILMAEEQERAQDEPQRPSEPPAEPPPAEPPSAEPPAQ